MVERYVSLKKDLVVERAEAGLALVHAAEVIVDHGVVAVLGAAVAHEVLLSLGHSLVAARKIAKHYDTVDIFVLDM